MTDPSRTTGDDRSQDAPADRFGRREFVALGAGVGATMLAGCAGDGGLASDGSDGSDGSQTLTGNFRLLISDAPADIDDFDELNVTLDEARIFEARDEEGEDDEEDDEETDETDDEDADDEDDGSDQAGNETEEESDSPNGTAEEDEDADDEDEENEEDEENDEDEDDEEDRGFTVIDLGGETVDLTQVIGEDATAVFDGEIPAGTYAKVELEVSAVEGIVEGEAVDVKLPSEKLQITNEFEVTPDEPVSFVFDINVVKRGKNNGYILKPVISGSGVAGRDVDVNEIDDEDDDDEDEGDDGDDESDEDDSDGDANETEDDGATENETDGAENETAA